MAKTGTHLGVNEIHYFAWLLFTKKKIKTNDVCEIIKPKGGCVNKQGFIILIFRYCFMIVNLGGSVFFNLSQWVKQQPLPMK